jgi:putative endonuclease
LGNRGEQAVVDWYLAQGFELVARNWRCPVGEIDIVVRRSRLLVVCEVKTRSSDRFGAPEESVTPVKVRRLRRLAAAFLSEARVCGRVGLDVRFDVASVTVVRGQLAIDVIEGAF